MKWRPAEQWTGSASADLQRIHEFLEPVDPAAAARAVQAVVVRVLVRKYEVRYEVASSDLYVLRIFHTSAAFTR